MTQKHVFVLMLDSCDIQNLKKYHFISHLFYHLDTVKSVLKHENKEEGSWQLCDDPLNRMLCHNIPSTFSYVVSTSGRYSLKN